MTLDALHSRLSRYLARHVPEHEGRPLGPLVELKGGWASSLHTFTIPPVGSGELSAATWVLKLYAPDDAGRAHALREWRALTHLRAADYRVPVVLVVEPDAGPLGRPFLVMEHIASTSFWSAFEAGDSKARARLTQSFADQLVALHALDPALLDASLVPAHRYGSIDDELARLRRDGEASEHPALLDVVAWLQERRGRVPCERPVILHRDYHPWNVLVDAGGRLWVIDWDWRIGDARFDLAWTCTLMARSGHDSFSRAVRDEYARRVEPPLQEWAYFEVLATVRWLLNVLPAVGPRSQMGAAARADFRSFLAEPVQRAQTSLQASTGIAVRLTV